MQRQVMRTASILFCAQNWKILKFFVGCCFNFCVGGVHMHMLGALLERPEDGSDLELELQAVVSSTG